MPRVRSHGTRRGGYAQRGVSLVNHDRTVNSKIVKCPTCGAEVGEHCAPVTGPHAGDQSAMDGPHRTRRRMAIRKEREDQS